jgi:hypothetical protein
VRASSLQPKRLLAVATRLKQMKSDKLHCALALILAMILSLPVNDATSAVRSTNDAHLELI